LEPQTASKRDRESLERWEREREREKWARERWEREKERERWARESESERMKRVKNRLDRDKSVSEVLE
jgi:hypothetical protein